MGCSQVLVNNIVKLCAVVVLITSLSYTTSCAYSISVLQSTTPPPENDPEDNEHFIFTTPPPSTYKTTTATAHRRHKTVDLITLSISIPVSLLQALSCLNLIFRSSKTDPDSFKKWGRYWVFTQLFLLVVITVCFFIPFSFDHEGKHESLQNFLDKTNSHFGEVVEDVKDNKKVDHSGHVVTVVGFVHVSVVFVVLLVVVVLVECGNKIVTNGGGYSGIR